MGASTSNISVICLYVGMPLSLCSAKLNNAIVFNEQPSETYICSENDSIEAVAAAALSSSACGVKGVRIEVETLLVS